MKSIRVGFIPFGTVRQVTTSSVRLGIIRFPLPHAETTPCSVASMLVQGSEDDRDDRWPKLKARPPRRRHISRYALLLP
ncbi:hypothetical protein Cob_v008039 [Colletotrichum orbiculare MAFF 240422]|uniref:Uncharacterized protein n=1 Tax=Colletotrichum orbiculare (strain 104-T / ATCC 96160 / CBS 514.97 / LARS 414 / MAFF 240422) TaxID=1213857 RepID=A0A484FPQ6_COLOR|nr:hypothetical protein Cob_v008039 [Colletotrichum orbiculare MAFF 240422]